LALILLANRAREVLFLFFRESLVLLLHGLAFDARQHARGLFTAHDADARAGPCP